VCAGPGTSRLPPLLCSSCARRRRQAAASPRLATQSRLPGQERPGLTVEAGAGARARRGSLGVVGRWSLISPAVTGPNGARATGGHGARATGRGPATRRDSDTANRPSPATACADSGPRCCARRARSGSDPDAACADDYGPRPVQLRTLAAIRLGPWGLGTAAGRSAEDRNSYRAVKLWGGGRASAARGRSARAGVRAQRGGLSQARPSVLSRPSRAIRVGPSSYCPARSAAGPRPPAGAEAGRPAGRRSCSRHEPRVRRRAASAAQARGRGPAPGPARARRGSGCGPARRVRRPPRSDRVIEARARCGATAAFLAASANAHRCDHAAVFLLRAPQSHLSFPPHQQSLRLTLSAPARQHASSVTAALLARVTEPPASVLPAAPDERQQLHLRSLRFSAAAGSSVVSNFGAEEGPKLAVKLRAG
jgi:hypothetical protein